MEKVSMGKIKYGSGCSLNSSEWDFVLVLYTS